MKCINVVLGNPCVHISWTGPGEPPEDGEMNEMTLLARHRMWNSSLTSPHNKASSRVNGEETYCFFETWRQEWDSNPRSLTFQAGGFDHCTRAPATTVEYITMSVVLIHRPIDDWSKIQYVGNVYILLINESISQHSSNPYVKVNTNCSFLLDNLL